MQRKETACLIAANRSSSTGVEYHSLLEGHFSDGEEKEDLNSNPPTHPRVLQTKQDLISSECIF